jgi:hypothetical protein
MKRMYSLILLLSLLVGTLQPILPMIEYQLHDGDIVELLGFGEESANTICDMTICTMKDCETPEGQATQSLLDLDYYPLALQITAIPSPHVFLSSTRCYLPSAKHVNSPPILPIPPPPRSS